MKTTKIILVGKFLDLEIKDLIPSFILTQEYQISDSKIRNRNDFEIKDFFSKSLGDDNVEIIVNWIPKQ